MPLVSESSAIDLSISAEPSPGVIELEVPEVYSKVIVALPQGANDKKAVARWKHGVMRIILPQHKA